MSRRPDAELRKAYLQHLCCASNPLRAAAWPEWLRLTVGGTLALGATLGPAGCGGESTAGEQPSGAGEGACLLDDCSAECSDGVDNDQDGAIDCDDTSCAADAACVGGGGASPNVPGTEICSDGVDNDADGSIDCRDPDCSADPSCTATGGTAGTGGAPGSGGLSGFGGTVYGIPLEICTDGVDNDYDRLVDCDDPNCNGYVACQGTGGIPASGGSGGDGATGGDPSTGGVGGLGGTPVYGIPLEICIDGVDNDYDTLVDCDDPDCTGSVACQGTGGASGSGGQPGVGGDPGSGGLSGSGGTVYGIPLEDCSNGVDDNYNGLVDCDDLDCTGSVACQGAGGASGAGGQPGVGGDSGGGGLSGFGGVYGIPWEECDNGADDDYDGLADCEDPDCSEDPACMGASGAGGEGGSPGVNACILAGGVCSAVAVVASPCASCDPTMAQGHIPAPPSDSAMGCTVDGVGATPLCCLPVLEAGDCVNAGGGCYPPSSNGDTCPAGWGAVYTACPGGDTCCVPGPDCDDSG